MLLLYFILGCIFIILGIPLLESLALIISGFAEYVIYIFAYKISILKSKISEGLEEQQYQQNQQPRKIGFVTQAIGFSTDQEEEEDQV